MTAGSLPLHNGSLAPAHTGNCRSYQAINAQRLEKVKLGQSLDNQQEPIWIRKATEFDEQTDCLQITRYGK